MVDVAIEEKLSIAVVSMGSSKTYMSRLKEEGIKVIHAVGSVKHAKNTESDGVDAVVCEGYEAGGHLCGEELSLFVLLPQIVDVVKMPIIAGGVIVDERGVVAALALGAEGVYMGTRFMATTQCMVHSNVKQAIIDAVDNSTVAFARRTQTISCIQIFVTMFRWGYPRG